MDADHDLPAHAEDLDAAFAEAVADAGPHDLAEPPPPADLLLRAPEPATVDERQSAAVDERQFAAVDDRERAAVDEREFAAVDERQPAAADERQFAAVDERQSAAVDERQFAAVDVRQPAAVDEREFAAVDERQSAAVDERQFAAVDERQSSAVGRWIAQVAGISVAVVGGAAIVLTMLVPSTREPAAADRPVAAAVGERASAAAAERPHAAVVKSVPALAPAPAWRLSDEWTGGRKKSVAYEIAAARPVRLWMRQATPVLVVRCLGGTLDAFVVTGSASAIEPGRSDHRVRLAFDDRPAETEHWTDSADHDGLFAPDGPGVVARLASARTLRFTFTPHNAPDAEAVFDVSGTDSLRERLDKHCRRR